MRRIGCALALAMGLSLFAPALPALADDMGADAVEQAEVTGTEEGAQDAGMTDPASDTAVEDDNTPAVVDVQGVEDAPAPSAADEAVSENPATVDDGTSTDDGAPATDDAPVAGETSAAADVSAADVEAAASEVGEGQTPAQEPEQAAQQAIAQQPAEAAAKQPAALATQDAEDETEAEEPVVQNKDAFTLAPSAAASARVAVAGNSKASGTNVELAAAKTLLGEYWRVAARSDGAWKIVNFVGNRALTVSGTPKSGSNVSVVSGTGTGWIIERNDDGTVCVIPLGYKSLRLALAGGNTAAGTNLLLAKAKAGAASQRFVLTLAEALTESVAEGAKVDADIVVATSAVDKTKALSVADASKANGGNVQLGAKSSSIAQKFVLHKMGNNLYMLQNANSGKFLECAKGATSSGTNVRQWARNDTLAQLWYFVRQSDGTYSIRSAKSGLALGVRSASTYDGANVQIQKVNSGNRQKFNVKSTSLYPNGRVVRLTPCNATSTVVAVASNKAGSGANAQLGSYGYILGQWWRISSSKGLTFKLVSMRAENALGVSGKLVNDANINVSKAGTTWVARINDGGTLTLSPSGKASLVIDVEKGGKTAGTNIRVHKSNGTVAQQFKVVYNPWLTAAVTKGLREDAAVYNVVSALKTKLVADVAKGSTESGANVRIHGANGTDAQKWYLESAGNGLYRLRCAKSGLSLGVAGKGRKNGSNVAHLKSDESLFQLWFLIESGKGCVVRNAASGLALDVDGGKAAGDANMEVNKVSGAKSQTWILKEKPLLADGTYAFSSDLTYYGMLVFEVKGGSTTSGANVQVQQTNGTAAQKWVLSYKGAGEYTIANKKSGLMLAVANKSNSNGGNVIQQKKVNSAYQRWVLTVTPNGGIGFMNAGSGKMMEIAGGKSDNGINVQQRTSANVKYQSWHVKTNHEPLPSGKLGKFVKRMIYYADIVSVGYDQLTPDRWNIKNGGECDCSSLVINCLREAGFNTGDVKSHIGKVNAGQPRSGCTYTGDMSYCLTRNGWKRISFSLSKLKPGDILLNDTYHTCAVIGGLGENAYIAQASIDENYDGWGGKAGDQTGYETNIKKAYVYGYGWNCILRYGA